jgi:hypothetical protein
MKVLLFFIGVLYVTVCSGNNPDKIEYVQDVDVANGAKSLEESGVGLAVIKFLGITNIPNIQGKIVGWSIKLSNQDQPPVVYEEVILCQQLSTNKWVIAYVSRTACRYRLRLDEWSEGLTATGMDWVWFRTEKPTDEDLIKFIKQSNFGNNECSPDIHPVHTIIYAPYRSLLKVASVGLSDSEKQRRFEGRSGIIHDPADAFRRRK